ncbi:MAG: glycosyltransferase family 4 protein [Chlorobiaceae bacterium]|nr:glycosyltransferase family 4 protein [Chlorobiaceae bacterium]
MRVQLYHQFYAGAEAPGPAQPRKLTRLLADRGHEVDVIACDFNVYNEQDELSEDYRSVSGGRVTVHRLPAPRGLRSSLQNRLKTYLSFAWSAYWYGGRLAVPDVLMASIQPLFVGYSALRLARRWKKPLLLEVRDLWPDALVVKGALAPWQAVPIQAMARKLYHGAARLVSLTPGIKTELVKKGIDRRGLDLFPNGFDEDAFRLEPGTRELVREQYGWGETFVAIYTGIHAEVTAVEVIVRAASLLRERHDIRFDLFGSGQSKAGAVALAEQLGLENIHFHDPVAKSVIPSILAGADAGIMTLFESPLIHIYFENKFIDYMGAHKPILAAMGGVQAELITRFGAGMVVPAFDHEGLAKAVVDTAADPERCREMGEAGYRFISKNLVQREILERYADVLEALAKGEVDRMPTWDPFTCI